VVEDISRQGEEFVRSSDIGADFAENQNGCFNFYEINLKPIGITIYIQ
jgi:hypothetical protein